jgi:hypothetical protein
MKETIETTNENTEETQENIQENTTEENQTSKQPFDYKKEREERIKHKTEKNFLNEIGVKSMDEIKQKLESLDTYVNELNNLKSELEKSKVNGYKVEILKSGFDDRFADYIVHDLQSQVSEGKDFNKELNKYKESNPQFLKNEKAIKYTTSSDFESSKSATSTNQRMNDFLSGKTKTI